MAAKTFPAYVSAAVLAAGIVVVSASAPASAKCLLKGAEATAESEKSARWYALETMVQSVSWGIWPAFVADGSTPGWKITKQAYKCKPSGAGVYCRGAATFCPVK